MGENDGKMTRKGERKFYPLQEEMFSEGSWLLVTERMEVSRWAEGRQEREARIEEGRQEREGAARIFGLQQTPSSPLNRDCLT